MNKIYFKFNQEMAIIGYIIGYVFSPLFSFGIELFFYCEKHLNCSTHSFSFLHT